MARPVKYGIDTISLSVDFFESETMLKLSHEFGVKGQVAVIHLLLAIGLNGYFLQWDADARDRLLVRMPSVSADLLDAIVRRLVGWGFFDSSLFGSASVLSSERIQADYLRAVKRRKGDAPLVHWIVKTAGGAPPPEPKPPQAAMPAPATADSAYLDEFFSDANEIRLIDLCKNLGFGSPDIGRLRTLALEVVTEWQLVHQAHSDYSDFARHLISSMRIKARNKNNSNANKYRHNHSGSAVLPEGLSEYGLRE